MARTWRVAVLGLGHWYSAYAMARALGEYPKATLVAAGWHVRERVEAFARTFGIPAYTDCAELLAREDVDIVHIAAPVVELEELTVMAARAGKHIVLGKPMAMDAAQAGRMAEAVTKAGVGCMPLGSTTRLRLGGVKRHVDAGRVGTPLLLHATCRWSIAEDWYRSGRPGWFADPAQVPGGAFIDEGIYWIDVFRWLFASEVVRVEARTANLVHKDIAVEDWGMATLTFANGGIATLEAGWTITAPRRTAPSPKHNAVVRLEVVGSEGEIAEQWFRIPGRALLAAGADDWIYERQSEEPFAPAAPLPLAHFIDALESGRPPIASIEDARRALVIAMAAYESARESRPVTLAW